MNIFRHLPATVSRLPRDVSLSWSCKPRHRCSLRRGSVHMFSGLEMSEARVSDTSSAWFKNLHLQHTYRKNVCWRSCTHSVRSAAVSLYDKTVAHKVLKEVRQSHNHSGCMKGKSFIVTALEATPIENEPSWLQLKILFQQCCRHAFSGSGPDQVLSIYNYRTYPDVSKNKVETPHQPAYSFPTIQNRKYAWQKSHPVTSDHIHHTHSAPQYRHHGVPRTQRR